MESYRILKYKNIDIHKIILSQYDITYNSNKFFIQTPIFNDYELLNYDSKKYIELKLQDEKIAHVKFLTLIDALELKLNNFSGKNIKTQIITDIQNKKSIKVKLSNDTIFFNNNKNIIKHLFSKKISLLFKLEFYKTYYSLCAVQILQLN